MNRRFIQAAFLFLLACVSALLPSGCARRPPQPAATPSDATLARTRPGIGTMWGEDRISWVQPTSFARANGDRPHAMGVVHYNDLDGVNATLDYLGGEAREATGLQPAGDVSFGLRDGEGRWLKTWALKTWRFAVGEKGRRYEVVLKNLSARPVEVVITVDGLDTLDGERGRKEKRGYVIEPREEFAVEGFRRTDGTVAAFRFGEMPQTYAQRRHGDTKNVGAIGVAVFRQGSGSDAGTEGRQPIRPAKPGEGPGREYAPPPPEA
jgi:hypothetical protein